MTVIVAASWGTEAWIGCDQAGTDGWGVQGEHGTKLHRAPFGWLGFTGSYRTLQAIHRRLRAVTQIRGEEDMEALIKEIEFGLQEAGWCKSGGDGLPTCKDLSLLLVTNEGAIWTIQSDFAFLQHRHFAAVGSGYQVALGGLHASHAGGESSKAAAGRGIEAACDVISSCAHPAPLQIVRQAHTMDNHSIDGGAS